ncbi:AmmeMemoRadiSam system protein B [uncultured Desulfosarcina sp.]|uniref:AmmeMemoRadiSam system protein B n=1 Tax=uncultured Desulfosarcina sp. TaxID=218289 RepID=UPI0029C88B11|nr:AmmeMemoRadiSam system protein B [uncultured Desulfosarcina sp.]
MRFLIIFSTIFFLAADALWPTGIGHAAVREPAWAGRFYPASREDLAHLVDTLIRQAEQEAEASGQGSHLRALIMPHAGYAYSGITAAHAARAIVRDSFDRVLLLGPDHRVGFDHASITAASQWRTPLGTVPIGDIGPVVDKRPEWFDRVAASDRSEHCLEVVLPFLQTRLLRFELIPLVLGPCDTAGMARVLADLVDDSRTLVVVSADLSHYLPYDAAVKRDKETLERIIALDPNWLDDQENRTCGRYPVGVLLALARSRHWRPVLLHYNNSGDTAGDKDAVVGYGAVAFYGGEPMQSSSDASQALSPEQGEVLVVLSRRTLADHFGKTFSSDEARQLDALLADPALQTRCGTFVTLKIDNQLRGCIGSLAATAKMVDGVRENALNAAFHDPRFPPLKKKELDAVQIEVSVLTEPVALEYTDADDLLAKLKPGVDGVIIRKGYASATFLPQVWEQLPRPESFLSHLCMKAGLPSDQWRKGDLTVLVYGVQYFEEER